MDRVDRFWTRVTDGMRADQLWKQFITDARSSYQLYSKEIDAERAAGVPKFKHFVRMVGQFFWAVLEKLSPARRVLLLVAILLILFPGGEATWRGSAGDVTYSLNTHFYGGLLMFVLLVLGTVVALFRIPLAAFYHAVREPYLIAFSTASSEAALPLALENMERFGVPKHIVGFVIPTGYSFNLDGTTLYLSLASVFVAQAAGVRLPFSDQLFMMLTLMLTSKGVAGVPRAALVILAGTLTTFHLPLEGVAILLGVDALLDMARTSVNVLGNCLASAVVARWEQGR